MKRVLVTGSNGFMGRNLVEQIQDRYEVLAPKRQELDLLDDAAVRAYLERNPVDVIVHSATTPGHRNAAAVSNLAYRNLRMFFNLVRCSASYGRMLHVGSGAEYDMRNYTPRMKEGDFGRHVPLDEHGLSKYVISRYIETAPENVHNLRPFGVYGRYEDWEIRFPSNAVCKALYGRPITMRQNRRFSYLWVDDFTPVVEHFIEHAPKHRVYNVVPDEAVELKDVAEAAREASGRDLGIVIAQPGLGMEYTGDNARLRAEIPGLKFTPLRDAVRQLYRFYESKKQDIPEAALLADK